MGTFGVTTPVAELAAAELGLDRLLTSFDVGYWRVREPRSGLTLGHRVAYQTRLNVAARRASSGRGSFDDLRGVSPTTMVARPAVLLRNWRRSCTQLRGALATPVEPGMSGWLSQHVDALHDLVREVAADHACWSERSGPAVDRRRRAG